MRSYGKAIRMAATTVMAASVLSAATLAGAFDWVGGIQHTMAQQDGSQQKPISTVATTRPSENNCQPQTVLASQLMPFAECPSYTLDFSAQPDGGFNHPDFTVYNGRPEANDEAQYYTNSFNNIRVYSGELLLTARNEPLNGYRYTSARLDTKGKKDFQYGRIVVRAVLPGGTGTWPAIWMLSSDEKYRQFNPASAGHHDQADGEMDIAEAVGTEPNKVYGIAHSLSSWQGERGNYFSTMVVPGNDSAYHDYELRWTPTRLSYLIDGQEFYSVDKRPGADYRDWPYDQPYYLILNLALGGSWGGTDRRNFPVDGVDPSALPATLKVKSINYYPYTGK